MERIKHSFKFFGILLLVAAFLTACEKDDDDNGNGGGNGGGGNNNEVIADFQMIPTCCPPVSATGRYFNLVEMELLNESEGEGLLNATWTISSGAGDSEIIGGTPFSPVYLIPIDNRYNEATISVTLYVEDNNGNNDAITKSITLPVLKPTGFVTIDGMTCEFDLNELADDITWYIRLPYYYKYVDGNASMNPSGYQINVPGELFEAIGCPNTPFSWFSGLRIRVGGETPIQTVTPMEQIDDFWPTTGYFTTIGSIDTFDSASNSSGTITLSAVDEGTEMIAQATFEGLAGNPDDPTEFTIELNWLPKICYYDAWHPFCDE